MVQWKIEGRWGESIIAWRLGANKQEHDTVIRIPQMQRTRDLSELLQRFFIFEFLVSWFRNTVRNIRTKMDTSDTTFTLGTLNTDVLRIVLNQLDLQTLRIVGSCCKALHKISNSIVASRNIVRATAEIVNEETRYDCFSINLNIFFFMHSA